MLGIAAGAILCGYRAISDWARSFGQKSRERFGCRRQQGRYVVLCEYIFRDVLIRVAPVHLDRALRRWNEVYAQKDETLAIDGLQRWHYRKVFRLCPEEDHQKLATLPQCGGISLTVAVAGCGGERSGGTGGREFTNSLAGQREREPTARITAAARHLD